MNKMIKGAAIAGVGVALLLGGGGTLAVWNDAQESNAGTIVAGDLKLDADQGVWTSSLSGKIASIAQHRIIPGETLTYAQPLTVTLEGKNLEATLKVTGAAANEGFTADNVTVGVPTLTKGGDVLESTVLTEDTDGSVVASTTFTFKASTSGRDSVKAKYNFSGIGYTLEQVAPGDN